MSTLKIVLIGAGNIATHLGQELKTKGNTIVQIYSRTINSAKVLGEKLDCNYTNVKSEIVTEADLYLIALSDNAIESFVSDFNFNNKLVVHTSGSISIDIFKNISTCGVLYPLQTFTKGRSLNFKEIPFFIEANTELGIKALKSLAQQLSDNVSYCDSEQRKYIHLAAVFVSNFTNHLISVADNIMDRNNISHEIFGPLLKETISKAGSISAIKSQTGPAHRNDVDIMNSHMDLLSFNPQFQKIYKELSNSIISEKEKK